MIGASDIDALLPQTQCTRCGYTGCLPYAEAIARGEAESTSARRAARRPSSHWRSSPAGQRRHSIATTVSKPRPPWRSSTKSAASAAPSACRPARWMPLPERRGACTPSSRSCARVVSCACAVPGRLHHHDSVAGEPASFAGTAAGARLTRPVRSPQRTRGAPGGRAGRDSRRKKARRAKPEPMNSTR